MFVVLLGRPGSGKGTQASRLATELGIPQIATGDILREAVQSGSDVGRRAKATIDAGGLVSDELMIDIVRERLARPDAAAGFILDGFPRTRRQADALDAMLDGRGTLRVLHIAVPEEEIVRRLGARRICGSCGVTAPPDTPPDAACARCGGTLVTRSDDTADVIRRRLTVYEREAAPLVAYYRERPGYVEIDGNQEPSAVAAGIEAALGGVGAESRGARGADS